MIVKMFMAVLLMRLDGPIQSGPDQGCAGRGPRPRHGCRAPHITSNLTLRRKPARAVVTYRRMLDDWLAGDAISTVNAADTEQIANRCRGKRPTPLPGRRPTPMLWP